MLNNIPISNKKLILQIILILIISSISIILVSSIFLKKMALTNLGEDDAKKTSELIFEIMNTKMQEGWAKNDLVAIVNRLEHVREGLNINSYRSKKVEELFGVYEKDKKIINNDPLIQKALKGEKQFLIEDDGTIRYLYPMSVKKECIACHTNTNIGDINGVLDIKYPPNQIKISLDILVKYFMVFFIIFILISFIILYFIINKKIITPIVQFTKNIDEISKDPTLSKTSNIYPKIKEIFILENNFNNLIRKIKFYYDQLLSNLYTDSLTNLSNNVKLKEDIKQHKRNSLIIINVDSFSEINNFYGVKIGDNILQHIAKHLKKESKNIGSLYRLYSDEFAILTQKKISKEDCLQLLESLNKEKYIYDKAQIQIQCSIGVVYDNDDRIIEKATVAVKSAKNKKSLYEEFDNSLELNEKYTKHIKWSSNIKKALNNDNIIPYFQAIKDLNTNEIKKYECLVRLNQDDKVYTPYEFLDISKKAKLYPLITKKMIEKSFEYFKDKKDLEFSINISIDDISNPSTSEYLFKMIEKYDIGSRLIIELLESEEIYDFKFLESFVNKLREYKVKIAIDDFGSGYSNFSYILNLKVDFIKIDSSLIKNLDTNEESRIIVESIINFTKHINTKTVAEFVHKKEIEDILKNIGVDYAQGYYIGKPRKDIL